MLLLDSIRQCEGVARILQSKSGEILDIKPPKNKVAPIGGKVDDIVDIFWINFFWDLFANEHFISAGKGKKIHTFCNSTLALK